MITVIHVPVHQSLLLVSFRRTSDELPVYFRRTSDELSAMLRRTPGKLLDFATIFLVSSDELLWQSPGLLDWFLQNFR